MQTLLRQVCGIDVAKDELVCTLGRLNSNLQTELFARKTFTNSLAGFTALWSFVQKKTDPTVSVRYAMEATGSYHEELAYWLHEQQGEVSIILPNKMAAYMRTLDIKTVTDSTAADAICRFSLERSQQRWQAPGLIYRKLRRLSRERSQIVAERTQVKNALHALRHSYQPAARTEERLKSRIDFLNQQEAEVVKELRQTAASDVELKAAVELICTVKGVGALTAITILAETAGFSLIRNKRQLTSYAGLDVKEKQSGTSVKGKAKISKRGNRHLRSCLHFPALTAVRHDERFKAIYIRLLSRHGIKMKALVAVQRRLLELIYTIFKTKTPYDKDYQEKTERSLIDRSALADHK